MDMKQAIQRHGLTIAAVAEKFGISPSALSQQINGGTLSIARAEEIARIARVPLTQFLADGDELTAIVQKGGRSWVAHSVAELEFIAAMLKTERG